MLNKIYKKLILSFVFILCLSFVDSAKVYLSGADNGIILNCPNVIDVMLDPQGKEIFGAVVNLSYDWKNIEIVGFYPNEEFNLPVYFKDSKDGDIGILEISMLSLNRNDDFVHVGFDDIVKFGTIIVKNKIDLASFDIDFISVGNSVITENMSVFDLLAKDVLKEVESKTFNFVQGECLHTSPDGINQIDPDYDFRVHLDKNLNNISNLEKKYSYKNIILKYWSYGLMFILIIILFIVMYKRGMFKNIRVLKNKENKND